MKEDLFKIRNAPKIVRPTIISIIDGKTVELCSSPFLKDKLVGLWSNNPDLTEIIQKYFELKCAT
jgi:hypothetical protein